MANILLIDDDDQFKTSFQMDTQSRGIKLIHRKSLTGLQEVMSEHHKKITAIVLDIKCLITDSQPKESEDFIGAATKYLDENFPKFPRLILTGDDDAFDGYRKFFAFENIYKKTPDGITDALNKLDFFISNSDVLHIKRAHADVFALFDQGLYSGGDEASLVRVLKSLDEKDYSKFRGVMTNVRALQETVYKAINAKSKAVVPDSKFKSNGMIKFNDLMRHLDGHPDSSFKPTTKVYHNQSISNMTKSLYWVCGSLVHADPSEKYFVSNYTVKSMIYSLLEVILWSKLYL
jgi:hypothetical protein